MNASRPSGRIEVICGCMFAGKTTRLIERLVAAERGGRGVLAFKHAQDTRYDEAALATHDGRRLRATPIADAEAILDAVQRADMESGAGAAARGRGETAERGRGETAARGRGETAARGRGPLPGVEVVGIDEGHFFELALVEVVERLTAQGRRVIVTGLDNDMWGRPLPPFPELKRIAALVNVLHVPCSACGRPARYSQRVTPIVGGNLVGGTADYEPRCVACFVAARQPAPAYGQRL